jgi:hypothetical protein
LGAIAHLMLCWPIHMIRMRISRGIHWPIIGLGRPIGIDKNSGLPILNAYCSRITLLYFGSKKSLSVELQ